MGTIPFVLYVMQTTLGILKDYHAGSGLTTIPEGIVAIARAAYQAYQLHTGEPLDESKIKPFETIR